MIRFNMHPQAANDQYSKALEEVFNLGVATRIDLLRQYPEAEVLCVANSGKDFVQNLETLPKGALISIILYAIDKDAKDSLAAEQLMLIARSVELDIDK